MRHPTVATGFLVFVPWLLPGCFGDLSRAQDNFQKAAEIEKMSKLEVSRHLDDYQVELFAPTSARVYYASALAELERIDWGWINLARRSLESNGLMGTKLTLESLCHRKLGNFDRALALAERAMTADDVARLNPRDRALRIALAGFILVDNAYDIYLHRDEPEPGPSGWIQPVGVPTLDPSPPPPPPRERIDTCLRRALQRFGEARETVDYNHPLQSYLIQAQLSAHRVAYLVRRAFDERVPDAERQEVTDLLEELLGSLPVSSDTRRVYLAWNNSLGQEEKR